MDDDLGVAVRPEDMALLQARPQGLVVVDFAVGDEGDAAVFAPERLSSAGGIDDGQPAVAQRHVAHYTDGQAVRPAMAKTLDRGVYQADDRCNTRGRARPLVRGDNSTHRSPKDWRRADPTTVDRARLDCRDVEQPGNGRATRKRDPNRRKG